MRSAFLVLVLLLSCGPPPSASEPSVEPARRGSALAAPPRCEDDAPPAPADTPPALVLRDGHTQTIMDLELSRDGRIVATAGMSPPSASRRTKSSPPGSLRT